MKKRWISLLLVLCIMLSLLSVTALADGTDGTESYEAAIGETQYTTLAEAIQKVKPNETIRLLDDVVHKGTIVLNAGQNFELDLNDHDLAFEPATGAQSGFMIGKVNLRVVGSGKIYETKPNYSPFMVYGATKDQADYSVLYIGKDVVVEGWAGVFINGTGSAPRTAYGIRIQVDGTLNSVHDTSGYAGHGVYINGTARLMDGNVPEITLSETSVVTSFGNGIYAAGFAKWNLAGSITGSDALSIKSGIFDITGGVYISTGAYRDPVANGNGSENTGAALSITSNASYARKVDITVSGGQFISKNGYAVYEGIAEKDGVPAASESYVTLAIEGGTFTGNAGIGAVSINEAKEKEVITGGTYSSNVGQYIEGTHDGAVLAANKFVVGKYADNAVSSELGTLFAAKVTLQSGADVYYGSLTDAVAAFTGTDVSITLLRSDATPLTVDQAMVIYKNGFTAKIEPAAGFACNETVDSYVVYPFSAPATGVYTIQYQLETLDGNYEDDAQVTGVNAEDVSSTIQAKTYTGFSLADVQLDEGTSTYTVQFNRNVYTIVFADGQTTLEQRSLKYGAEIVAPVPEKPGYLFRSWSGYTEGMTVTGNATFTAFWVQYPAAPGYEIDVPGSVSNGSITASSPTANAGSIVILTVTPDEGYQLDQLTVTDAAGNALELTALGNGQYTFKMPYAAVEVSVSFKSTAVEEELPFADVAKNDWFYADVLYVYENELMDGVSDTAFMPYGETSRAMVATVLWRLAGAPVVDDELVFTDVPEGEWYTEAVRWAASVGVVDGYTDTTFMPNTLITREQLAVMFYRFEKEINGSVADSAELTFDDAGAISDWAVDGVAWCVANGIVEGKTDTTFAPQNTALRAEFAAMLHRYLER